MVQNYESVFSALSFLVYPELSPIAQCVSSTTWIQPTLQQCLSVLLNVMNNKSAKAIESWVFPTSPWYVLKIDKKVLPHQF